MPADGRLHFPEQVAVTANFAASGGNRAALLGRPVERVTDAKEFVVFNPPPLRTQPASVETPSVGGGTSPRTRTAYTFAPPDALVLEGRVLMPGIGVDLRDGNGFPEIHQKAAALAAGKESRLFGSVLVRLPSAVGQHRNGSAGTDALL